MLFSAGRFLKDHFQSPKRLHAFLTAYKAPTPNEAAIEKWFQRQIIPGAWLPVILAFMELEQGAPVRLAPYLESA